jgi:hypothetical protein
MRHNSGMKRAEHGRGRTAPPREQFPRAVASACARKSFERELARLRSMSVEERIMEALTMSEEFAWLEPTAITKDE